MKLSEKGQVSFSGCARAWGMEAMSSTNPVDVTSSSSYELTAKNTIKNRTDNVQPIATHENKTQGPILEVSPRDLPTSPFAVSTLISILRRCFWPHIPLLKYYPLQNLKICKNYSVTPHVPQAMDVIQHNSGTRQASPLPLHYNAWDDTENHKMSGWPWILKMQAQI
jgi:hypothetical protein